jgi:hypothetical protein
MTLRERVLYHQIHPLKLLADGSAEIVSCRLLWQHRLRAGLLVHFVPPVVASAALLRWGDLEPQRRSAFGRYVARHMTRQMEAVRFAGDLVMAAGAWYRRPALLAAGLAIVLAGWLRGLWGRAE